MTPISTATNKPGKPIDFPGYAGPIAITPNGRTAYVLSRAFSVQGGRVTPINTATNKALKAIKLPNVGVIAITPNGKTAYVTTSAGVVPISTATMGAARTTALRQRRWADSGPPPQQRTARCEARVEARHGRRSEGSDEADG